jgi:uncharacterized membrane protein YbhN (UPF0104 family)
MAFKVSIRKRYINIFNLLLTGLLFYFAFNYMAVLLSTANFETLIGERWLFIVASFAIFVVFYVVFSYHWLLVCRLISKNVDNILILAFFASQPYKYLPTSLFSFSFRAKFAKDLGMGLKQSSYVQLLENFNILSSGALIATVFFVAHHSFTLGIALGLGSFFVAYFVHRRKFVLRLPKSKKIIPIYRMAPAFLVMCSVWIIGGTSFLLTNYAFGLNPNYLLAISGNAAAYVASILAFFAPGGIGVREFVLATFSIQATAIVAWRLLTFSADMLLGFLAVLYIKYKARRIEP